METLRRNKLKWIGALIIAIAVIAVTVFVAAGDTVKYLCNITNTGATQAKANDNSMIHRQIIESESTSSEIVFETKIKNTTQPRRDVAVVLDTSYSMQINTDAQDLYTEVSKFVRGIYNAYPGNNTYVSVSNNNKSNVLTNNVNTAAGYVTAANLPIGGAGDLNAGLNNAYATFNQAVASEKYMIIFTDATDAVKETLQKLNEDYGVNVVSILINLNSNQFVNLNNNTTVAGVVKPIVTDDIGNTSYEDVYDIIKSGLKDIVIEDMLSQKGINYFDLEVDSAYVNDVELVLKNGKVVGYKYKIQELLSQQTKTIKYRLRLKSNINNVMDIGDVYGPDVATHDTLKATYTCGGVDTVIETKDSPTIQIGKAFSVTILAVNENSKDIKLGGVEFKVIAKEVTSGKVIVNDTITTSSTGKIVIDDLITTDNIMFDITPNITQLGYVATPPSQFTVEYNPLSRRREIKNEGIDWEEEETKSNINVYIPINVKKFNFNVELQDLTNSLTKIGKSEFQLIQPKLNNKTEMNVLKGTTHETTGVVTFSASVMTKDGYYDYILSQLSVNTNFELMGSSRIRVWFKDGNVVNMKIMDNDKVSPDNPAYTQNSVNVIVGNLSLAQESFTFNAHVEDDETSSPIQGASYRIKTTTHTGQILNYGPYVTDTNGNFTAELFGAGYVKIEVIEETPNPAYTPDPTAKSVTIYRNNGTVERLATSPVGMGVQEDTINNSVNATIKSVKKKDQNIVRIELVETTDERVKLSGISVNLIKLSDGTTYTLVSNEKGIVEFALPNEAKGKYTYEIEILNPPAGYDYAKNVTEDNKTGNVRIDVEFDENGKIDYTYMAASLASPVLKYEPIDESNTDSALIGQYVELGLDLQYTKGCDFTVQLQSKNPQAPIKGGKYNIIIVMTLENGQTVRKEIKEVETDENGQIVTPLIKANYIDIQVWQVATAEGYKIEGKTQDISITNEDGTLKLITDSPHSQSEGLGMGTSIYGDAIVYNHKNEVITTEDTYLNLHVTKKDEDGGFVSGIGLRVSAEEPDLVRVDNGKPISEEPIEATTDDNGEIDLLRLIRVTKIPDDGTTVTYNFTVVEYDLISGEEIPSSLVKYRIVYRFNPNSSQVELKNLDIIVGKRLEIYSKHSGYLTSYGYESRVELDLYTNYGDIGNFSIDLSKYSSNGEELSGAKYKITVTRPTGTISTYEKEVTDAIELTGFFVSEQATIEIQEIEAPVGYQVNNTAELIRVTKIDEITKAISIQLESTAYNPPRAVIEYDNDIMLDDGTMKKELSLKLIDYEQDTFKFGIKALDKEELSPVSGYKFNVTTSKGAYQISGPTNQEGKTSMLVGGSYKSEGPITYKIKTATAAPYYKDMNPEIEVQVYFDGEGKVDLAQTMAGQTDAGFGTTWSIIATNTTKGNDIDIQLLVEPQPKLTVNIQTVDEASGQDVLGIKYKIPESVNIVAEGTNQLKVGYVLPGAIQTYTLQNIDVSTATYAYNIIPNQTFQVQYDNDGIITGTPTVNGDYIEYVSHSGREINLKIKIEPKVAFTVENKAYLPQEPLQGAKFEITNVTATNNETAEGETDANGFAKIYNGRHGENSEVTYLVKQTVAKLGYAKVEDFYVKVTYNEDKTITNATLADVNGNTIQNADNRWVNVSFVIPTNTTIGYNGNTRGIVNIEVLNYPALKFNIENVDRRDFTKKLGGTEYSVVSNINTGDMTAPTDNITGKTIAYLDKTKLGGTAIYTIRQTKASAGYQSIDPIMLKVYFDNDGYVSTTNPPELIKVDESGNEVLTSLPYVEISTIPADQRVTIYDQFEVNIQIRNNPLLKLKINKKDEEKTQDINNVTFSLKGVDKSTNETIVDLTGITGSAGVQGELIFGIDYTYDNKTIEYTIKETKKAVGYKWIDNEIKVEVDYDQDGRVIVPNGYRITQGSELIEITGADAYNFTIDTIVVNEEIEEFGVHMIVEDRYDPGKKLQRVVTNNDGTTTTDDYKVEMKLTNYSPTSSGSSNMVDMGTLTMKAGRDDDHDGSPDVAYGEDYQTYGEMVDDEGKPFTHGYIYITPQNTPNTYYQNTTSTSTVYQAMKYRMIVEVSLDDEGKLTNASIYNELHYPMPQIQQYITIEYTPGKYTLKIRLHYFPMLQFGINAIDEYTKDRLKDAKFEISTTYGYNVGGTEYQKQIIKAGYIGDGYSVGNRYDSKWVYGNPYTIQYTTNTDLVGPMAGFAPIESKDNATLFTQEGEVVRRVYIYEITEPNANTIQYQQYEPRYNSGSDYRNRKLLTYVDVYYNAKGEIDRYDIAPGKSIDNNNTPDGTMYVKTAKSQYGNPHSICLDIEYKPTTTIKVNILDQVTKAPIGNLRVYPFMNQSSILTSRSYEYRTQNYYEVNSSGKVSWTYWGGNNTLSDTHYTIGTDFRGNRNENYELPGTIELQITHDQYGRITNAVVISVNSYGEPNAVPVSWNETTLELDILCYRKFNVELFKFDKYETTKRLNAVFGITSNKGLNVTARPSAINTLGIIYPGQTVTYTISEITAPSGYLPLEIFDLTVQFGNNGTILSTNVNSSEKLIQEQYKQVEVAKYAPTIEETRHKDLVANLYDRPCFTIQLELQDEFYPGVKIPGGQFEITSSMGDTVQGTPITNNNGFFEVYIGEPYKGQTVNYTIKQVNTVSGYHTNTNVATLQVKFKNDGKIEQYTILNPAPANYSINKSAFVNQKYVKVVVTNMPKDVKIGLTKYDKTTNELMSGIEFNVIKELVSGQTIETQIVTDANGVVTEVIDEFNKRQSPLVVKYTIKEITKPNSYRKIQDVVLQVRYNTDGRIGNYQVLSNPSNVEVQVALGSQIKYTGGKPVHIALRVPNDNSYDLLVKDEDTNYQGLGIYGTKYNTTINGIVLPQGFTNTNGIVQYLSRTENGRIEIRVAEAPDGIGEGYRANLLNDITFVVNKGEIEYTIDLDEADLTSRGYEYIGPDINNITGDKTYEVTIDKATSTKATLIINEVFGTIQVIFKNETKLELTMIKHDIDTNQLLKNAKFEITKQVVEPIPQDSVTITTVGVDDITDGNGKLYFDLGVAPQNQKVKYTFKEITPPLNPITNEPYGEILDIEVFVLFDSYGRVNPKTGITENSPRTNAYMGSMTGLSHSINVEIANGALNQGFKLKVVSEDSESGARLNGSIFEIEANDVETGNNLYKNVLAQTRNNPGLYGITTQSGTYISPSISADFEGKIEININQVVFLEGYESGNNTTSGKIVIEKDNIDTGVSTTADINLTFVSSDFDNADVTISVPNREITVVIRNNPNLIINLTKIYKDRKNQTKRLSGAVFNITAQKIENGEMVDTDINVTTTATNDNGYATINVPILGSGNTFIYTIKEQAIDNFDLLPDVVLKVSYDINNNITKYEILSDTTITKIAEQRGLEIVSYKVENGIRVIDRREWVDVGILGRKVLPTTIENELSAIDTPYVIQIDKIAGGSNIEESKDENTPPQPPVLIPGAKYEIRVIEEFGVDITWQQYTNEDGKLISRDFFGYGNIRVAITEIEAPANFELDPRTKHMEFTRDKVTGEITPIPIACDVDYKISSDNKTVVLKPQDDPSTLTMYLYKVSRTDRFRITDDTAKFEVYLSEDGSVVKVGEGETDSNGALVLNNLQRPSKAGNYDYIIREVKVPSGYEGIENDIIINVEFIEDEEGNLYIASRPAWNDENVELIRYGKQYISMNVFNFKNTGAKVTAKKVNSITNYRIESDETEFEVYLADAEGTTLLKKVKADERGTLDFGSLAGPKEAGTCTYIFKEIVTPDGYQEYTGEMRMDVTYSADANGQKYIEKVLSQNSHIQVNRYTKDYIDININNVPDGQSYTLVLEKHTMIDNDFTLIPGGTYRIRVEEEYGETREWVETTNENGVIVSDVLKGYGYINVYLEELTAPNGFKLDGTEHHIEFFKDKSTGEFSEGSGDVDFSYADTNKSVVYVKPRDEIGDGQYSVVINKIDANSRKLIKNNPAKFEVYLKDKITNIKDKIGEIEVPETGYTRVDELVMPKEPGKYTLIFEEVTTPYGYITPEHGLEVEVEFGADMILDVKSNDELVECPKWAKDYMTLNILNKPKEEEIKDEYAIEITKLDATTGEVIRPSLEEETTTPEEGNTTFNPSEENMLIEDKKALFELTDEEDNKTYVYTDLEGKALFNKIEKPESLPDGQNVLEKIYTLREVMAPTGYELNKKPITIKLKFTLNDNNEIVLEATNIVVESQGGNVKNATLDENKIKLDITNTVEPEIPDNPDNPDAKTGEYNIILTKIDSKTKEIIPSEAEITVALENGQRVLSRTKEDGKIQILEIKVPEEAGVYEYVITENMAPNGYILNDKPQIFKITFEENPNDTNKLIVTNAEVVVNGQEVSIIEVTSFANNTVEINIENEKDESVEEDPLYLKSKLDDTGEVIYDVFQQEDVPFTGHNDPRVRTYTIDEPFIDTKTMLKKRTRDYLGITVDEFIGNLDTNADTIKVYDPDGTEITGTTRIKTGGSIKAIKGSQELNYKLAVKGDGNGDGWLTTQDSLAIKQINSDQGEFTGLQKRALDVDSDGRLRPIDSVAIKNRLAE